MSKDDIKYELEEDADSVDKKVKKIKEQFKKCEHERAEYLAGWQRAKADYINLQREHEKKIADYFKFANEGLILELLPVLDSFEAAIKNPPTGGQAGEDEGIEQLYNQLSNNLKSNGLEEIKAVGEKFNPELHEAVETIKSDKGEGIITEEIQKGYKLHGKTIRPAKVKISK